MKITENTDDQKSPVPSLPVLSETIGLSYDYDFEFLMQLYHTYYQWKEAALDELAQFKSHAMGEILAEMKAQSN